MKCLLRDSYSVNKSIIIKNVASNHCNKCLKFILLAFVNEKTTITNNY